MPIFLFFVLADDPDLRPGQRYTLAAPDKIEALVPYLQARLKLCIELTGDKANQVKQALAKKKLTCATVKPGKGPVVVTAADVTPLGTLTAVQGVVTTRGGWDLDTVEAKKDDTFYTKQTLSVGAGKSRAEISLSADSKLQVWSDSEVNAIKRGKKDLYDVELVKGAMTVKTKQPMAVKTVGGIVTVKGPRTKIRSEGDRAIVVAIQGGFTVAQGKKTVEIGEGQGVFLKANTATNALLPAAPEAVMPSEGQRFPVILGEKVGFSWRPSTKVSLIEVGTDAELNAIVFAGEGETDAGQLELEPGNYYWQVTAVDEQHVESIPQGPRLFVVERRTEPVASAPVAAEPVPRETLTLVVPAAGSEQSVTTTTFEVVGEVRPIDASVTVNGTKVNTDSSGHFALPVELTAGDNEISVEAADGPQKQVATVKVHSAPDRSPHRIALQMSPIVPFNFRTQNFGVSAQLSYSYSFNPYIALRAAAGGGALSAKEIPDNGAAFSPFYVFDVGAVAELLEHGFVIPYVELNPASLWLWHNRDFPDSSDDTLGRTGRARAAYAPNAGVGVRFKKDGASIGLGAHYRVLVDQGNTSGHERTRLHSLLELRMALSFQ